MSEVTSDNKPLDDGYITVQCLGSGWAAVWKRKFLLKITGETFEDVWSTGLGRYKTRGPAAREAARWAEDEGIECNL